MNYTVAEKYIFCYIFHMFIYWTSVVDKLCIDGKFCIKCLITVSTDQLVMNSTTAVDNNASLNSTPESCLETGEKNGDKICRYTSRRRGGGSDILTSDLIFPDSLNRITNDSDWNFGYLFYRKIQAELKTCKTLNGELQSQNNKMQDQLRFLVRFWLFVNFVHFVKKSVGIFLFFYKFLYFRCNRYFPCIFFLYIRALYFFSLEGL